MIPKIIHYCWFGHSEQSPLINYCLKSWQERLPDYKIMLWNEDNFDVFSTEYTKKAYNAKKWAFVSDYVRLYALKRYGGIYLDTDIEVINDFSFILSENRLVTSFTEGGLISTFFIAAPPNHIFIDALLSFYEREFAVSNDFIMNPIIFSAVGLKEFSINIGIKEYKDSLFALYQQEFFAPIRKNIFGKDSLKKYLITKNTCTIHHDCGSWKKQKGIKKFIKGMARIIIPYKIYNYLKIRQNKKMIKENMHY